MEGTNCSVSLPKMRRIITQRRIKKTVITFKNISYIYSFYWKISSFLCLHKISIPHKVIQASIINIPQTRPYIIKDPW